MSWSRYGVCKKWPDQTMDSLVVVLYSVLTSRYYYSIIIVFYPPLRLLYFVLTSSLPISSANC